MRRLEPREPAAAAAAAARQQLRAEQDAAFAEACLCWASRSQQSGAFQPVVMQMFWPKPLRCITSYQALVRLRGQTVPLLFLSLRLLSAAAPGLLRLGIPLADTPPRCRLCPVSCNAF